MRKTQELGAVKATAGAPGMEMPDGRVQPYEVLLVMADGSTTVFASYPKPTESCCSINVDEHDAI